MVTLVCTECPVLPTEQLIQGRGRFELWVKLKYRKLSSKYAVFPSRSSFSSFFPPFLLFSFYFSHSLCFNNYKHFKLPLWFVGSIFVGT